MQRVPALKLIQIAVVTASTLCLGGLATQDLWDRETPQSEMVPEHETSNGASWSNAPGGVVIPDVELSAASVAADFAFHTHSGAGDEVQLSADRLVLATKKKKARQRKIRFGAFEGY